MNSNTKEEDILHFFVVPIPSSKVDSFRVWVCLTKDCQYTLADIRNAMEPFSKPSVALWNGDNSVIYSWECPDGNLPIIRYRMNEAEYTEILDNEGIYKMFSNHPHPY